MIKVHLMLYGDPRGAVNICDGKPFIQPDGPHSEWARCFHCAFICATYWKTPEINDPLPLYEENNMEFYQLVKHIDQTVEYLETHNWSKEALSLVRNLLREAGIVRGECVGIPAEEYKVQPSLYARWLLGQIIDISYAPHELDRSIMLSSWHEIARDFLKQHKQPLSIRQLSFDEVQNIFRNVVKVKVEPNHIGENVSDSDGARYLNVCDGKTFENLNGSCIPTCQVCIEKVAQREKAKYEPIIEEQPSVTFTNCHFEAGAAEINVPEEPKKYLEVYVGDASHDLVESIQQLLIDFDASYRISYEEVDVELEERIRDQVANNYIINQPAQKED